MAGKKQKTDQGMSKQMNIFDIISGLEAAATKKDGLGPEPGSLMIGSMVRERLSQTLKRSMYKRYEVAGRMSELLGIEITDSMLYSWTAESKESHRFPLEYLPAFCWATGDLGIAESVAKRCGARLVKGEEVVLLELARIAEKKRQADEEKRLMDEEEAALREYLSAMRGEER
jgi:hypothetical protein